MYVTVGRRKISVILGQDVRDQEGNHTYEVFRPGDLSIVLDTTTPKDRRRRCIVHALDHAYDFLFGKIAEDDVEGRANRTATIEEQFNADLVKQHGDGVIDSLFGDETSVLAENLPGDPIRIPYGNDDSGAEWPTDVGCPGCGQVHRAASIQNAEPYFDTKIDGYAMVRALACTTCDRDSVWVQRCSFDGMPWPKMVSPPIVTRAKFQPA